MGKKAMIIVCILVAASLPLYAGAYFLSVFNTIFVYMSLSLTWDMMLRTGQLSYGTAGKFGLGACFLALVGAEAGVHPRPRHVLGRLFGGQVALLLGVV